MSESNGTRKIARLVKGNYYRALLRAQDSGLLPADTDYTRFILMASSRTGSTLLMQSLGQHPNVQVFGEIVRNYDCFADYVHQFKGSDDLFRENPSEFLGTRVFRKYPTSVAAVGFKVLYQHAPRDTQWGDEVWRFLLGLPQLNVIHLKRRNLLNVYVSKTLAGDAQEWTKYSSASDKKSEITIDVNDMLAFFAWRRSAENDFDALFANRPLLQLRYEDLATDFDATLAQVQLFLGLEPIPVPQAVKQRKRKPLSEQIANYDELTAALDGTEWASFLED